MRGLILLAMMLVLILLTMVAIMTLVMIPITIIVGRFDILIKMLRLIFQNLKEGCNKISSLIGFRLLREYFF